MNRFYLAVRLVVLLALFFLLAAVFWGLANRDKTIAQGNEEIAEEYRRTKPAAYTSYLLIAFVVVGIFIVLGSILYEYHEVRKVRPLADFQKEGTGKPRGYWG